MTIVARIVCAVLLSTGASMTAHAAETAKAPRLALPTPAEMSPEVRKAYEVGPINVTRMLTRASEGVFLAHMQFSNALYFASKLDPVLREMAVLRVGYISKAAYEIYQHEPAARFRGITEAQIAALRQGGQHPDVFTPAQQAVIDFTDDVVKNVRASDATLAAVRQHLSDTDVIDLMFVIGQYMTISRILETAGVPQDTTPIDWKSQTAKGKAETAK